MSRVIYHYNNNNEKEHIHVTPEEKANCKKCCCKKLPTLKRKSEYKKANLLKPVYTSGDGTDFSLGHPDYEYKYGCLDFNNDCKAWMQPDGSWGYSNSGLICTNESGKGESLVVDIGCNDGVLLERFLPRGIRTLGVDPAENIAKLSKRRGLEVLVDFFGARCANGILEKYGPAQALTMTNAFPHIPDVDDLLSGVRSLIAPEGVLAIQAHYVVDMFEQAAFDTIYHEHVSYWSLSVMKGLLSRFGLEPVRVERLPIHHGQLRVYIQRVGVGTVENNVNELLELEARLGIAEGRPLIEFADAAQRVRRDVRKFLEVARSEGKSVAAYGAPAKGSTLINYLGLGRRDLAWIADISELKQGRYMPGSHIPIVAPSQILADMPDYLLLLAWNFAEEILEQNKRYTDSGGRFVLPLPTVEIL